MKNIHILPTDKPSRLIFDKEENRLLPLQDKLVFMEHQNLIENQNIYITSDEEIKEGDYLPLYGEWTNNIEGFKKWDGKLLLMAKGLQLKIILTTDPDLIKDGVQAIDDEFLKWFVKNPSCEKVKIETFKELGYSHGIGRSCFYEKYKIIIPKEESVNPNNQEVMFHEEHQEYFHEDFVDGKLVTVWLGKDYVPKEEHAQELNCPYDFTSRCTIEKCDCKTKQETIKEEITIDEIEKQITLTEARGERIIKYLNNYKGQSIYNEIALAIEFGYQLKLEEDER